MSSAPTLHQRFAEQAARHGDRVAVTDGGRSLTYRQLDRRADTVAARLRALGHGPGSLVGLCVARGADLVVGMLGVLKAGAAYVPVDPAYPEERIRFLLRDGDVSAVVSVTRVRDRVPDGGVPVLWLDALEPLPGEAPGAAPDADGGDLAYVIHTSGTTGTPKGVLVEHRNAVALFEQTAELVGHRDDDVWTLFHSASFDFSVWEIWGALLHGARLVIVPAGTARSPELLRELLVTERVTVLSQTPSAFARLVAADQARPPAGYALRLVVLGGERLDVKLLDPWFQRYGDDRPVVLNMYGITETTVHVTWRRITRADLDEPGVSPIGVPLPGVTLTLCDTRGRPVPDGTPGEILVGGTGVARGYLRRPELTAERFVTGAGPGMPAGARLYRSGDRAVRTADGGYQYLGRADDQLKVRGYRIEPGEIEAVLVRPPRIGAAHVTVSDRGEGDLRLTAHLTAVPDRPLADAELSVVTAELTALAAAALPEHMRPSDHLFVESVPLTPQGKADRAALAALPHRRAAAPAPAGGTPTERAVAAVVAEVMGRAGQGPDDDLFGLGVTSLAFVRIIADVNRRWGLRLTGAELDEPTIRALAARIDAAA
ncbi:amino acid adenylation domain-containing protein [Streptomyces specialis]|uniref:amino acid adenylation domain-containing protein n=1 Tax=Streptomyces specialis TaxID=498367 RepID=UPI00073F6A66|nr:amino acid adenylation domain-containing protein [Streptomyces specialis]